MATSSVKIEEFEDTPTIEEFPDDPAPAIQEFADDEDLARQEGTKATLGALQTIDVIGTPRRFDWSDVNEQLDKDRFYESESLQAQAGMNPQQAPALLAQSQQLRNEITPYTTVGQYINRQALLDQQNRVDVEQTKAHQSTPADLLAGFAGPALTAQTQPITDNAARNIGPAIGGAVAGAAFGGTFGGPIGFGMGLVGGMMGGMTGGFGQEALLRGTETDEETSARQQRAAEEVEANPIGSRIGAIGVNAPLFRPSISNLAAALSGEREALRNVGIAAGIGAATEGLAAAGEKRVPTLADLATGALGNAIMSEPTRLGRMLFSHPGSLAKRIVDGPLHFERPVEIPAEAGTGLTDRGITSTADVFANVPRREGPKSVGEEALTPAPPAEPAPPAAEPAPLAEPAPAEAPPAETVPVKPAAEPPSTPENPSSDPTGIRNSVVDAARRTAQMAAREEPARRAFGTVLDEAKAVIANDADAGRRLVNELKENVRPLTDREDAVLTLEQNRRELAREAAIEEVNNAQDEESRDAALARLAHTENEAFDIYQVGQNAGTENARGLNARRMMLNRDYSLAKMLNETRAVKNQGEPLTEAQTQEVTALHKRIAELEGKLGDVDAKKSAEEAKGEFRRLMTEARKQAQTAAKEKRGVVDFFESQAEAARQRIIARRGRLQTTVDPLNIAGLVDEAIIGASHLAKGIRDFGEWSKKMVGEFGERIRPQLQALFSRAGQIADEQAKILTKAAPAPSAPELTGSYINKLILDYVRGGETDLASAVSRATKELKSSFPEVTERQVQDLFSGYGKTTQPSKEADQVQLRELRNLARLTSQLEDAQRGLTPLKTGPQRDKATARVRDLQRQVNEAMKKAGVSTRSPETQLASAHTARVTRLTHQLEDISRQMAAGKRDEQGTPLPWTPEEIALRNQVEEARLRLDDLLNEPESDKLRSLLSRITLARERIVSGDIFRPARKQGPDTREVALAKNELSKLNAEMAAMRKAQKLRENPPKTADEKKLDALEKQREKLFKKLTEKDVSTKTGASRPDTAEQAKVREEISKLNEQLRELRDGPKITKTADEKRVEAMTKRRDELQRRLAAGDISVRTSAPRPDTPEQAQLRSEIESLTKQMRDLRGSSEDLRLAAAKTRIRSQVRSLEDKIARNDYSETPKREQPVDQERINLEFDLAKVKQEYQKGLIEARRERRGMGEKIWDTTKEVFNLSRQLLTSGDLPPIFRQGLFSIGRPKMAASALKDALHAMVSEKKRFAIDREIQNRPNAPLYQRAKLYLAKDTGQTLTQQEEAYMGNWFKELPRWTVVGPFLRASERSYNTFLNKLRADTFDAAVKAYSIAPTETAHLRALADVVNTMTGRAKLPGRALEQGAGALNTFLFAPRFLASRFKLAVGQPLWSGTSKSRKFALEQYARTLSGAALMYGLAKMAGAQVETDPRSTDFLKIRFGDTRLDPLGGLIQVTNFLTRVITGETKTQKGLMPLRENLRPLKGTAVGAKGHAPEGRMGSTIGSFLRTKLNPVAGGLLDAATGKDVTGKPVTPGDMAMRMTVPISFQDIATTMEKQGVPKGTALWVLSLFGMGLQTYGKK